MIFLFIFVYFLRERETLSPHYVQSISDFIFVLRVRCRISGTLEGFHTTEISFDTRSGDRFLIRSTLNPPMSEKVPRDLFAFSN